MSGLALNFLGSPQVLVDDKPLKITRRKALALLAYLAVTQQAHSRDALATMLWPDAGQSRSRASLRSVLWTLNKTPLAEWVLADAETVSWHLHAADAGEQEGALRVPTVDARHFRALLRAARRHEHASLAGCEQCAGLLAEAVALYRDDFLAGFTLPDAPQFDEWQFFEAESLRQELATALENLIAFHDEQQDYQSAISFARRRLALDALHEPAQRALMQLYAQAGQHSAALRQYEICRQALMTGLGVEPSPQTDELYRRLQSGALDGEAVIERRLLQEEPVPAGVASGVAHNLPPAPGPLVGRKHELVRLAEFLEDEQTRLVTITGPGGMGKTRLALAAARAQAAQPTFADGVYFVPLAPLATSQGIIPAIAEAAGFPFQAGERAPREQVFAFLSRKTMLLVLDNFEHLLLDGKADGADLVGALLQRAPGVKIVTTSREPLNLYEEQRLPLQGLPSGARGADADNDAATLFLQTVRRNVPDFALAPDDAPILQEVCRLVQGMPLALELSAAWADVLSLDEIAAEIRDNLDFMETRARNVPERHRSMQAVFESSWQSLSEAEQAIYAQLSVFRGGFTQDVAQEVTGASREALAGLVHKSLLQFDHRRKRYENHELLRQFAAVKLGDDVAAARDRHAASYLTFLEQREADLKGARQQAALGEIEADDENVAAAWRHAVGQGQVGLLERAIEPLCLFFERRTRFVEGEILLGVAVERLDAMSPEGERQNPATRVETARREHLVVQLLTWQGRYNLFLERFEEARRLLQRAQQMLATLGLEQRKTAATRAFLLLHLSDYAIINKFGGEAEALNEESLALYRAIEDEWGTALALDAFGQKKMNLGQHEEALQLLEECLAIRQQLGDKQGVARAYNILGLMVLHMGQIERSEAYLRQSLSLFRTLDNRAHLATPLAVLGINQLFGGKFEACIAAYEEAWTIHEELGLEKEPHTANVGMTRARINLGQYEEARCQAQKDLEVYRALDHRWSIAFTLFNLGRIDLVEGAAVSAVERLRESIDILREMNERSLLPDVFFTLAYAYVALDDMQQAVHHMIEGLKMAIATEPLNPMRFELPGMALLLARQGQEERAVAFYAAAMQSPYIANSQWFEDIAGKRIAEIAVGLPPDVAQAAEARGQARDLWQTANDLLEELVSEWAVGDG